MAEPLLQKIPQLVVLIELPRCRRVGFKKNKHIHEN